MPEEDGIGPARAPNNEELLRLIFESAKDFAIFSTTTEGTVTSWNSGAERLLGYSAHEIMGKSADVIFPAEEGGPEAAREERRVASAEGRAIDERWQMRKDGSKFWASGLLVPLKDPRAGFAKILRDLTERHLKDSELRETGERFRLLATNIPQLVFRCRSNGDRTWGSPQWIEFTGLSFAQSLEWGWLDAIHPEDRDATLKAWNEALRTGEYYIEHRVKRATDGQYRWHQTRARPITNGDPTPSEWVGTMTDIHEMRQLQDVQRVLMAELQHRTRNLLAIVRAIATGMLRKQPTPREFAKDFESRLQALGRVQGLTTRGSIENAPTDLREIVELEIQAHTKTPEDLSRIHIQGPPISLPHQATLPLGLVLHELATNAVKYGALSQPHANLTVNWRALEEGATKCLELEWKENAVKLPEGAGTRKGYGTELIEKALPYQLDARTHFRITASGAECRIVVPLTGEESKDDARRLANQQ